MSPVRLTYLDDLCRAFLRAPTQQRASELAHAVPDLSAALRAAWAERDAALTLLRETRPLVAEGTVRCECESCQETRALLARVDTALAAWGVT